MFGYREGDARNVRFLEGVLANHGPRNLPGDCYYWRGVHLCGHDPSYQVRGAGPRSGHANTYFACGPGVAVRGHCRALLVPNKDVADLGVLGEGLVEGQYCPSGKAEHHVDALGFEAFQYNLRAVQFHFRSPTRGPGFGPPGNSPIFNFLCRVKKIPTPKGAENPRYHPSSSPGMPGDLRTCNGCQPAKITCRLTAFGLAALRRVREPTTAGLSPYPGSLEVFGIPTTPLLSLSFFD